jgi:type II secretory pathway pseudopilin PulG
LLAIIVVSVLLAAIAPVIMLSAATRVQARRVELATQASRAYVDGVRAGAVAPPNSVVPLDPFDATSPSTDKFFKAAPAGNPLTACIPPGGITAPGAIKTNFYCPPIPTAPSLLLQEL